MSTTLRGGFGILGLILFWMCRGAAYPAHPAKREGPPDPDCSGRVWHAGAIIAGALFRLGNSNFRGGCIYFRGHVRGGGRTKRVMAQRKTYPHQMNLRCTGRGGVGLVWG